MTEPTNGPSNEPSNEPNEEPQKHSFGTMEYIIIACVVAFVLLGVYKVLRPHLPSGPAEQIAPPEGPTPAPDVSSTTKPN
jgi:hypothetical protein